MPKMTVYTLLDAVLWDQIVSSFLHYDIYYLSGYVKAFQLHGDGEPLLFFYEGENLRGINVAMKRDIAKDLHFAGRMPENTYFDFATPYGYGGWLIEGDGDKDVLFAVYEDWCRKHRIVSEFVRFHPVLENQKAVQKYYQVVALGTTIAMNISSPDVIWENLTSKNRNMIRKAKKNNLRVYNGRFHAAYSFFQKVYNATMDKDRADNYYYFDSVFYECVLNDLPYNSQIFCAQMTDGTVAAASIMLMANGQMHYHLSGTYREFQSLAPTNLLLYEAARWGCANGYKVLHLGGGVGSEEDSLYQFKKSFYRGEPRQFCIGQKIFLQEEYSAFVRQRGNIKKENFFPQYRE